MTPVAGTLERLAQRRWLVVALYAAGLLVATSVPVPPGLPAPRNSDKIVHFALYAGLGVLFLRAWCQRFAGREQDRRVIALCIVTTLLYGGLFGAFDEWHQQFVGRTMSFADWLADTIGVTFGASGVAFAQLRERRALRRNGDV